jgi:hypothetical protein
MNRHANLKPCATPSSARAGSRSPWLGEPMAARIGGFAALK